jgi:molybdopterin synthase catalytic subunit
MTHLTREPIDIAAWHRCAAEGKDGASVEFLGIVRGHEDGRPIACLEYEAYAPMAERLIARLIADASARWPLHHVDVRHRLGRVAVGEVAVFVGVRSAHREAAFAACRFLIDAIKEDVPIWKSAVGIDGEVVETRCAHGHQPH